MAFMCGLQSGACPHGGTFIRRMEYGVLVAYFAVLVCRSPVELVVDLLVVRVSWDEVFRLPVL